MARSLLLPPSAADIAEGWPRLIRDVPGLRVKLLRDVGNAMARLPTGSEGVLTPSPSWSNLIFKSDRCPHCGTQIEISKMDRGDFMVLGR